MGGIMGTERIKSDIATPSMPKSCETYLGRLGGGDAVWCVCTIALLVGLLVFFLLSS
jgi:hypothetical protein